METKFYLNKIIKIDNIENYSLSALSEIRKCYDKFLEKSEGVDPDYPMMRFGEGGKTIKGTNVYSLFEEDPEFKGLSDERLNK